MPVRNINARRYSENAKNVVIRSLNERLKSLGLGSPNGNGKVPPLPIRSTPNVAQATRDINETYGSPLVSPLSFSTFNHTTDLNFTTETSAIDTAHQPTDIGRADAQES